MSRATTPPLSEGKYQVFPSLSQVEFEKLKRSIAKSGIVVTVVVDQNDDIIDGHHRVRAWNELRADGVKVPDYKRSIRHFNDVDERIEMAVILNARRRHLDPKMRKSVARQLRKRE